MQRPSLIRKIRLVPPPPEPLPLKTPVVSKTIPFNKVYDFMSEQYLNVISLFVIILFLIVLMCRYLHKKKKSRLKQK